MVVWPWYECTWRGGESIPLAVPRTVQKQYLLLHAVGTVRVQRTCISHRILHFALLKANSCTTYSALVLARPVNPTSLLLKAISVSCTKFRETPLNPWITGELWTRKGLSTVLHLYLQKEWRTSNPDDSHCNFLLIQLSAQSGGNVSLMTLFLISSSANSFVVEFFVVLLSLVYWWMKASFILPFIGLASTREKMWIMILSQN